MGALADAFLTTGALVGVGVTGTAEERPTSGRMGRGVGVGIGEGTVTAFSFAFFFTLGSATTPFCLSASIAATSEVSQSSTEGTGEGGEGIFSDTTGGSCAGGGWTGFDDDELALVGRAEGSE